MNHLSHLLQRGLAGCLYVKYETALVLLLTEKQRPATAIEPGSLVTAMGHPALSPDMLVDDLLARFPELARLFFETRLGCVGCSMARFCTLKEVSAQYELDIEAFLVEAQAMITLYETGVHPDR